MKTRRAQKPDAQAFDEIHIVTVPRYKTSGMSGDEWRISARIELWRKGNKIVEASYRDIATAIQFLPFVYLNAIDEGKAFLAGESDICDQEGCHEQATVIYKLKARFCREGHKSNPYEYSQEPLIRKFCQRHSQRGDCRLDDADSNYEALEGGRTPAPLKDRKESIFGGVMEFDASKEN
jgi:hypothetical protein